GLGCAKTPAPAAHVETSRRNCAPWSRIVLRARCSIPCRRIVFSTFRNCMSFHTGWVLAVSKHFARWQCGAALLGLGLYPDRGHQRLDAHDVHYPSEIVSEHVECHLGGNLGQTLHHKMRRPHPHLQRAKGMLGGLATLAHSVRVLVEPLLYGLQHMLMLPARDPSLLASSAALFDRAALTGVGPVTAQN